MKTESTSARSSRRTAGRHSIMRLLLALLILLFLNYLGFRHYVHRDLSTSQFYTLSPKTVEVLKHLDSPITIYTFLDLNSPAASGQVDQITMLLKEYQRVAGKNIDVEKIDPNFDMPRAVTLQKQLRFNGSDHLLIFEKKGHPPQFVKQEDLYDFNPVTQQIGAFKGEQQITGVIINLVEGKLAKVYFTQGHGEHSLQDATTKLGYGILGENLKSDSISPDNLNLSQQGEVPADADAVVIAGPSISFSQLEVDALDKYLANNGKLLVLLDPFVTSNLNGLLKKYGIQYDDDLVLYRSGSIVGPAGEPVTLALAYIYQGGFSSHPITTKFAQSNLQLLLQNPRSLTIQTPDKEAPKTQFLLQTDADAWGWASKGGAMPEETKMLTFNKATDIPGPLTVAAVFDGGSVTDPTTKATGTGTRVVAVGCSNFLENDIADTVGINFFTNSLDWLVKKNAVLDIAPKKPQQYGVSLSPMQFRTVIWCALLWIPAIALVAGLITWFSRRK